MISGFRREVGDNCALLGYYAASSGNFLTKFIELSVKSSGVTNTIVPTGIPETSVINYHYSLRNNPEECSFHIKLLHSLQFELSSYDPAVDVTFICKLR